MYLPQYLNERGEIKADPGIDRAFVEFTTAVAAVATQTAAGTRPGRVACLAYGRKVSCPGVIATSIEQWPRRIEWWCPACGNSGSIFGWEWTRWNRLGTARNKSKSTLGVSAKRRKIARTKTRKAA